MDKTAVPDEVVETLQNRLDSMGLFTSAGRNSKYFIDRALTEAEIDALVGWCDDVVNAIRRHGLRT